MDKIKLGATGPAVAGLGLGCMGISDFYGTADRAESLATIRAALDAGLTLLDTGDSTAPAITRSCYARRSRAVRATVSSTA